MATLKEEIVTVVNFVLMRKTEEQTNEAVGSNIMNEN